MHNTACGSWLEQNITALRQGRVWPVGAKGAGHCPAPHLDDAGALPLNASTWGVASSSPGPRVAGRVPPQGHCPPRGSAPREPLGRQLLQHLGLCVLTGHCLVEGVVQGRRTLAVHRE